MLHTSRCGVTFLNRVPVCLTVSDYCQCSSVNPPLRLRGIGFSYSQHSKVYQPSTQMAGFYCSKIGRKISKLTLASLVTHVNLMNGHQYLSCSASVFHRKDLGFKLSTRSFYRKLQEIGKGFPRCKVDLLVGKPRSFFSRGSWRQILKVNEHRPCQCREFRKHNVCLPISEF